MLRYLYYRELGCILPLKQILEGFHHHLSSLQHHCLAQAYLGVQKSASWMVQSRLRRVALLIPRPLGFQETLELHQQCYLWLCNDSKNYINARPQFYRRDIILILYHIHPVALHTFNSKRMSVTWSNTVVACRTNILCVATVVSRITIWLGTHCGIVQRTLCSHSTTVTAIPAIINYVAVSSSIAL